MWYNEATPAKYGQEMPKAFLHVNTGAQCVEDCASVVGHIVLCN